VAKEWRRVKISARAVERRGASELVAAGAALARQGLVRGREGNLSVRLDERSCLLTPAGYDKGRMQRCELLVALIGQPPPPRASTESLLHLAILRRRSDLGAVIHAHPPALLALQARGEIPDPSLLFDGMLLVPAIAMVADLPPGSQELADACADALATAQAAVLLRHGAVTIGSRPGEALQRMETLELLARVMLAGGALR